MTGMREVDAIADCHAHVYYDAESWDRAEAIRDGLAARFAVRLGRWHDRPVGPHPQSMYQVAFAPADFGTIVPWLALNRGDLSILVHPLTGDDVADHSAHAMWLGDPLPLDLEALRGV
jgi:DOPA 4,5-dioxygenase